MEGLSSCMRREVDYIGRGAFTIAELQQEANCSRHARPALEDIGQRETACECDQEVEQHRRPLESLERFGSEVAAGAMRWNQWHCRDKAITKRRRSVSSDRDPAESADVESARKCAKLVNQVSSDC